MIGIYKLLKLPGMIIFYLFLIIGLLILINTGKGDLLLLINHNHNRLLDIFFKYWTFFGDGLIFLFLFIFFILRSYYYALFTALSIIVQTFLTQGMKRVVFDDVVRPKSFIQNFEHLHTVPGVEIYGLHAFPSGHTATAFTVALLLSIYVKNGRWSIFFILSALLVGVSRIYLLQHFFIDVYFGAIVGIFSVLLVFYLLTRQNIEHRYPWNSSLTGK